ncbi:MAG: diguanylate cyclase [Acidobacteriia bacterium]|nr:diguanylate cyclase [Terriglobia bacterium]
MRILVAEDEITFRHMLKTFLTKWGYQVVVVSDGLEAWKILQEEDRPRLAILDWMMPSMDGVEICRAIRERKSDPYLYLLLLTSRDQKQDVVEGIEAGADDYLIKPFDPRELRARIHAGERIIELEDRLIRAQEALRELATHDSLTGLLNRRACLDSLLAELDRGRRAGNPVCIVMADIDHFKRVNDAHGHLIGDEVLCEVARRMQSSLRRYDTIGRFGGEEFLLVLPGCSLEEGVKLAERICHLVRSEPAKAQNKSIDVSISLGVAVANQPVPGDLEVLLGSADAALYRAKEAGRNRVEFSANLPSPSSGTPD